MENDYSATVNDILCKYLNYIHHKQRIAKINRIVSGVQKPISKQEKTELLIQGEFIDKKLNYEYYCSPTEPFVFVCPKKLARKF